MEGRSDADPARFPPPSTTALPIVPGSSLRDVLRQHVTDSDPDAARTLFGPKSIHGEQDTFAGALAIGDAHLLALPVRCLAGIISYVTTPFILRRYERDLRRAGVITPPLPSEPAEEEALVPANTVNCIDGMLVLEDLDLRARSDDAALRAWATRIAEAVHPPDDAAARSDLACRLALLPDSVMSFLAETATEIRSRIAVCPETGTVRPEAPWYEENLPAETVLWGVFELSASNRSDERKV